MAKSFETKIYIMLIQFYRHEMSGDRRRWIYWRLVLLSWINGELLAFHFGICYLCQYDVGELINWGKEFNNE